MKNLTKGRIKQVLVKWGIMLSPVWVVAIVMIARKVHAHENPPQYRVLFYSNCSPAWSGGTIWQHGIGVPTGSSGQQVGPYCGIPAYYPGVYPWIVGTDSTGVMVIDTTTNYCGQGDILLGFCYTEVTWDNIQFFDVPNSTNQIIMPNGYTRAQYQLTGTNMPGWGAVLIMGRAVPMVSCPGGSGTGGQ